MASHRYRVIESLGHGGMGDVFRTWDEQESCQVALKMLRSLPEAASPLRIRFQREIGLLRRVIHHNVVQVFDSGDHRGQAWFTMEYVEGVTLRKRLQDGPRLGALRTATLIAGLADGLCACHEAGVIHRDVKPENVMVAADGTPKLMDFGLAILDDADSVTRLTGAGQFVGTLCCLPPEILGGCDYDGRSDVFQLGVVMYECLTGRHPWGPLGLAEMLGGGCYTNIPRPSTLTGDVDEALDALVMRALAPAPADRFPTAADLRDALAAWIEGAGATERVRRRYDSGRMQALSSSRPTRSVAAAGTDTTTGAGFVTRAIPTLIPVLHGPLVRLAVTVALVTALVVAHLQPTALDAGVAPRPPAANAAAPSDEQPDGGFGTASDPRPRGTTDLHEAAWNGDLETVAQLIARGARLSARDPNGRTPLHHALRRGHARVAAELLDAGARPAVGDDDGITPLHEAAGSGCEEMVQRLLAAGARADERAAEGDTPAYWAACRGHQHIVALLQSRTAR